MKKNFHCAFSLMEMMVVLLIVAIVAAATAPMVTKKMARNVGSGDSPWVFTGLNNNIAYNMSGNDNTTAMIGAASLPSGWNQHTRLFIDSGDNASHIAFGNGNATPLLLTVDPEKGRIGFSNATIPENSVAFGTAQTLSGGHSVAIGYGTNASVNAIAVGETSKASDASAIAIGRSSESSHTCSIAIGAEAKATAESSIAMGWSSEANHTGSIAIGKKTKASGIRSVAIGEGTDSSLTSASHECSVAIGSGARTSADHQIVLGTESDTVYIPGRLVIGGDAYININWSGKGLWLKTKHDNTDNNTRGWISDITRYGLGYWDDNGDHNLGTAYTSDKRLKNVGDKYTAGLEELKKLDFYHYTFKKDEAKTPMVGVMAQDLQKVFPDAVTKGDDGYLRIRLEDMFYAVINAVKELASRIDVQGQKIEKLEKENAELQKVNSDLLKMNSKLQEDIKNIEKRIENLEK